MIKNIIATIIVAIGSFHGYAWGQSFTNPQSEIQIAKMCNWNAETAVHVRQMQLKGVTEDEARNRLVVRLNSVTLPEGMEPVRQKMIDDTLKGVTIIYTFPEMFEDMDDTMLYNEIYHICDQEVRK